MNMKDCIARCGEAYIDKPMANFKLFLEGNMPPIRAYIAAHIVKKIQEQNSLFYANAIKVGRG